MKMEIDITILISLLAAPLAAGAAYGGVKVGMNGLKQSVVQIERIVSRLDEKVDGMAVDHGERIATLEAETSNLKAR